MFSNFLDLSRRRMRCTMSCIFLLFSFVFFFTQTMCIYSEHCLQNNITNLSIIFCSVLFCVCLVFSHGIRALQIPSPCLRFTLLILELQIPVFIPPTLIISIPVKDPILYPLPLSSLVKMGFFDRCCY